MYKKIAAVAEFLPPEPGAPKANLFRVRGPGDKIYYAYEFPHPAVAASVVLHDTARKAVLLIRRAIEPFHGHYAFPGGFLAVGEESIEETAARELLEETGVSIPSAALRLIDVRSHPDRDPRDHVFDIAFYAETEGVEARAGDETSAYRWVSTAEVGGLRLAFDHELLWQHVRERIFGEVR
jgi:8-oxo-dGTP diphosphatase